MYKNCTVGVVVPAYNEAGFVGEVIRTIPAFVDRVYAVDDRSTDGTWDEIQRAAASAGRRGADAGENGTGPVIETIRHEKNRGVGAAVVSGYHRAAADGLDVTAVMNGDGQMDPAVLERIVDPVVEDRADYAKGNRLRRRDHVDGMSAWRRVGNAALTFLTKVASGYWKMMDPQNGYTAISGRALETLDLDALYEDYGFCNDVLVRLNTRGMRVADVEMRAVYGDERSTIEYHRFIPSVSKLLLDRFLWRLKVRYLVTDFHPLVGLYLVGALTTILGAIGIGGSALSSALDREVPGPSTEFSVELGLVGLLSTTGAMTLDMFENEALETQVQAGEAGETVTSDHGDVAPDRDDEAITTDADGVEAGSSREGEGKPDDDRTSEEEPLSRVESLGNGSDGSVGEPTDGETPASASVD